MVLTLDDLAGKVTALEQEVEQYRQDILALEVQAASDNQFPVEMMRLDQLTMY